MTAWSSKALDKIGKYGHHTAQYIDPIVAPEARATTMKIVPRAAAANSERLLQQL